MDKRKLNYLFLFVFLLLLLFFPPFLKVHSISCVAENNNCPLELIANLEQLKGNNYLQARRKAISIISEDKLVGSYEIYFKLPATLLIKLKLARVDYILKDSKTGYFYFIDSSGDVLDKKNNINRESFIETDTYDLKVGQRLEDKILMPMLVFSYLDYLYKIDYSKLFEDRFEVKLNNGPLLILPVDQKDVRLIVGSVRFLISQLEENYEKFKLDKSYDNITIDFRYKNPVLK